jgi:hypothetical protein
MMLIALLVVLLPPLQTGATRTASTMQPDVDRLVRAAEKLAGTWPTQPPPAILPGASDLWVQASLDHKQRLQRLSFPEGIAFDGN